MAASPLRPRYGAKGVWTGTEMIVLGGREGTPMGGVHSGPPPRDLDFAQSVAAYDPAKDKWRWLAPTPFAPTDVSAAVVGGTVYVLTGLYHGKARLYAYDLAADAWRARARPPRGGYPNLVNTIVAAGTKVFAESSSLQGHPVDFLYDPATDRWTKTPKNPIGAALARTVVGLPDGRVLSVGGPLGRAQKPHYDGPRFYEAAAFDTVAGTWERLPRAPFVQGADPHWGVAGGRLINLSAQRDDGYGHADPPTYAVGGELDLRTNTWSALPKRPEGTDVLAAPYWASGAGGDVAVLEGWALDVPRGRWTQPPKLPSSAIGLSSPAAVFTGEQFLAWGGLISVGRPKEYRYTTSGVGWIWEPAKQGT